MEKNTSKVQDKEGYATLLRRLALVLIIGYIAAVVLFCFLAGEQLHLRQSRGNTVLPTADSGTVELISGSTVKQRFTTETTSGADRHSEGYSLQGQRPTPGPCWRSWWICAQGRRCCP